MALCSFVALSERDARSSEPRTCWEVGCCCSKFDDEYLSKGLRACLRAFDIFKAADMSTASA